MLDKLERISRALKTPLSNGRLTRSSAVGLSIVLVIVAMAAAISLFDSPSETFEVRSSSVNASADQGGAQGQASPKTCFVHVAGCVAMPGVYELEQGSRVIDAIQAAGGFAESADADSLNLARQVNDGERVVVASASTASSESESSEGTAGASSTTSHAGVVNLNTATAAQLETLPGIGQQTAAKIVKDRELNGPFMQVSDLTRVSGIGEKRLAALDGLVCV